MSVFIYVLLLLNTDPCVSVLSNVCYQRYVWPCSGRTSERSWM